VAGRSCTNRRMRTGGVHWSTAGSRGRAAADGGSQPGAPPRGESSIEVGDPLTILGDLDGESECDLTGLDCAAFVGEGEGEGGEKGFVRCSAVGATATWAARCGSFSRAAICHVIRVGSRGE
jgi:hypothetical protein